MTETSNPATFTLSTTGTTKTQEPLAERAERYRRLAQESAATHAAHIRAIRTLFGPAVSGVLTGGFNTVTDQYDDAFQEQRNATREANAERAVAELKLATVDTSIDVLRCHLDTLADELQRRSHRSGKPTPVMVEAARAASRIALEQAGR